MGDYSTTDGAVPFDDMEDPFAALLPNAAGAAYYHYMGSLTTPPCTNNSVWILIKEPLKASRAQIDKYRKGINAPNCTQLAERPKPELISGSPWDSQLGVNNRDIQALAGRTVRL